MSAVKSFKHVGTRLTFVGPYVRLSEYVSEGAGLSLSWRHGNTLSEPDRLIYFVFFKPMCESACFPTLPRCNVIDSAIGNRRVHLVIVYSVVLIDTWKLTISFPLSFSRARARACTHTHTLSLSHTHTHKHTPRGARTHTRARAQTERGRGETRAVSYTHLTLPTRR